MWTLILGVIFGLLASSGSETLQVTVRTCSLAGIFRAEGTSRHSLNYDMAIKVCEQQMSTIATEEQLQEAFNKSLQTCRYGWISNMSIAILRRQAHENCSKSMIGLIINPQVDPKELYDVYCYDETAGPKKNCSKAFVLKPTVAPARPEEPTAIQDFEEVTDMVSSYSTPTEEAVAEGPDVEPTPTGESETSVAPTSIPAGIDFIPGSGMELPEQDNVSTTISMPEEMSTPHKEDKRDHEHEEGYDQTEPSKNNGRVQDSSPNENAKNKGGSDSNWLVIILVIVAVAAILLLCVAVAKRKSWCGRKQTLIITKDTSEGNGAAAASGSQNQEMVTLMSKEKVQENGNTEEFTVITLEESSDKEQLA